jgi:hypothetical protein
MSEDLQKKPVRDLLENIRTNQEPPGVARRPLVRTELLDRIVFFALIGSLLLVAGAVIGMIWDLVEQVFGIRFIATVIVAVVSLCIFRMINSSAE